MFTLRLILSSVLISCSLFVSGCSESSARALRSVITSEQEEIAEVRTNLEKYLRALYWGDVDEATLFYIPELRQKERVKMADTKERERLVKYEVIELNLNPEGHTANAVAKIQFYKIPTYVVQTRVQDFEFTLKPPNWLISKIEDVPQK